MASTDAQKAQFATEQWFREQGLPYFVARKNRGRRLLARCAPVLLFLALAALAWAIYSHSSAIRFLSDDDSDLNETQLLVLLSLPIAVFLLPFVVALIAHRFLSTKVAWSRLVAWASIALLILINPLVAIGSPETTWWTETWNNALAVIGVLGLGWLGIGAFFGWSVRAAIRQLSAIWLLAAIALPLLMLVVIFAFYSQETWQMSSSLERGQVFWLLLFLLTTGLFFVIYSARKELRDLPQNLTPETRKLLRGDTPLADAQEPQEGSWKELDRSERANVVWVMVLAQCFQVLIFGVLVFAFMMVLAALSVSPPLVNQWSGRPDVPLQLLGLNLPIGQTPVRVSAFLSAIAALNFVVSVNSSKDYREAFFDPLIEQTGKALAVHAAYQSYLDAESSSTPLNSLSSLGTSPGPKLPERAQAKATKPKATKSDQVKPEQVNPNHVKPESAKRERSESGRTDLSDRDDIVDS